MSSRRCIYFILSLLGLSNSSIISKINSNVKLYKLETKIQITEGYNSKGASGRDVDIGCFEKEKGYRNADQKADEITHNHGITHTPVQCQQLCKIDHKCVQFNWIKDIGCYLKDTKATSFIYPRCKGLMVTGPKICPGLTHAEEVNHYPEEHKSVWSYNRQLGPKSWRKAFEKCSGNHQSPIDLYFAIPITNNHVNFLFYDSITNENTEVENDGHSVKLSMLDPSTATMSGGPLPGTYTFQQLHFHWGSEHMVNGKRFPLEMHMVHNLSGFGDRDLLKVSNGLAVAGFLFEISENDNPSLAALLNRFSIISTPGMKTKLNNTLSVPDIIFPATGGGFFSYLGSLMTPPCDEVVEWIVFKTTLNISTNQMATFQTLHDNENKILHDNFRPIQLLNGRMILSAE